MAYVPVNYQGDKENAEDVLNWISSELAAIASSFFDLDMVQLVTQNVAPSKPRTGMTLLADGTHWNPGSGAGVYTYYGAAWHKLG